MTQLTAWMASHPALAPWVGLGLLLVAAALVELLARLVIGPLARRAVVRSRSTWDDALIEQRVLSRLFRLAVPLVFLIGAPIVPGLAPWVRVLIERLAGAFMALIGVQATHGAIRAGGAVYEGRPGARDRPIKGYLQLVAIFVWVLGGIAMIALLAGRSPWGLLSGIGALTAVLMLIFKDTLLSLVASIQLTSSGLVRLDDWIEMPAFGADGDVIDIALHTVQVRNFDKTTTAIPTHALIDHPFKNWRSMPESGGRRIKRALLIDATTVREVDDALRARIDAVSAPGDAPAPTNLGRFRQYLERHLHAHAGINTEMTVLVRALAPTSHGLPLEVYCYTRDTAWLAHEALAAELFEHFHAVLPTFGLRAFQVCCGPDAAPR